MKRNSVSGRRKASGGLLAALFAIVCMVASVPATAESDVVQSCTDNFMSEALQAGIERNDNHEWVDLGLSVKWATCNVGASSPEKYGDYFAWGEITSKPAYNTNSKTDKKHLGDISGDPRYDAARANWGGKWRLPTKKEIDELHSMCTWTWTTRNGCKGCKITGPNGNSIFLPSAGFMSGRVALGTGVCGYYWCSTPYVDNTLKYAYEFNFNQKNYSAISRDRRPFGKSIRAVFDDSANSTVCKYVDLGLSVKWATCNVGASSPSDYGNYYTWGETTTKSKYTVGNCKTWNKHLGDIAGNRQYDVARANWGAPWRLPTKAEVQELIDNCTWTKTTLGGHNGYKVTSKINGNSIFLPAAGWRSGTSFNSKSETCTFWCSTPGEGGGPNAYYLYFDNLNHGVGRIERYYGLSIRPVSK
ncbi:hypothetical protein AB9N12_09615 [Bacteroides sp. AN502(2024)]|uniref:hypothetical protein n=1 Tax=Bacteroides sp. AN502(2024) TaxID=3160599 RepID=UPI00351572B4